MLWILGHTLDYIVANTGISLGSVRNIIDELNGEKIDVVEWNEEQSRHLLRRLGYSH